MAHCYILASMSSILQHQLKDYLSVRDMILSLKEIFGEQGRPAQKIVMRGLMNTKMAEGILVREYILKMFDHLNTLEILGGEIDAESQIDIILKLLFNSFNQFNLNRSMKKINFTLVELSNALQATYGIIKDHPSINNVKKALFSKSFPKEKGK